ncbi:MAG: DUF1566 domain-containing protein [Deltaproteobacteria bacterium]|nr:DUF1566 domain-containing protein [Deltaproteobacteria bacterium]
MSDDGSIHDKDNTYTWAQAFEKIEALNDTSFAGFDDWRLPNAFELASLLFFGSSEPTLAAPFDAGCTNGCTVLTCSCPGNLNRIYWTSTSFAPSPSGAWAVDFEIGVSYGSDKISFPLNVRAVRGGLVPGGMN